MAVASRSQTHVLDQTEMGPVDTVHTVSGAPGAADRGRNRLVCSLEFDNNLRYHAGDRHNTASEIVIPERVQERPP